MAIVTFIIAVTLHALALLTALASGILLERSANGEGETSGLAFFFSLVLTTCAFALPLI